MKKLLLIFLIIIYSLFLFSCTAPDPNTITFMVGGAPNEITFWESICTDFTNQTGIKINLIRQPTDSNERRQGLVIPLKARKNDPDIFLMDIAWLAQFAASNWLVDLNDHAIDTKPYFPKIIKFADTYKNQLIALPVYLDSGLLYYRKDLLKNPPKTWAELIEKGAVLQKKMQKNNPRFTAFVWQGAQYEGLICNFLEFCGSDGGILVKNKAIKINTPQNLKALKLMANLIHKHKLSPLSTFTEMKEEEVRLKFQAGEALFERNWPYAWALHNSSSSKVKNKVGLASIPSFSGSSGSPTLGGWHIGISRYSDAKTNSIKFLKYITSKQVQKQFALKLGWNPSRQDIYDDPEIIANLPHFRALKKSFSQARPRPNLPYYNLISQILQKHINSALSLRTTPGSALKNAEIEANKIAKRYED
ncbi:ABC transporter substrate-binding protein [Candidatus Margulisiibacteriota bacterium]